MNEKKTTYLNSLLNGTRNKAGLEAFLKENTGELSISDYMNQMLADKDMSAAEVIRRSNLSKDYANQLLNGTRSKPGRDKIIALCIGLGLNLSETQKALKIARCGELYSKDTRDAIIMYYINIEKWDIMEINNSLHDHNLKTIE